MVTRLERATRRSGGTFAYSSTAFPRWRHAGYDRGVRPHRAARSAAGEYTFSIFAVVAIT
jgi:hypothetical protein